MKFARLLVVEYAGKTKDRHSRWKCICDCGSIVVIQSFNLLSGRSSSCGCLRRELSASRHKKHGDSESRLYKVWCGIKTRCYNKKRDRYKDYGGRGIKVCDEWQEFEPFKAWALNNGYSPGLTIGRIDNNGDYSPQNCRWETICQQSRNTRRNRMIHGMCLTDYCLQIGFPVRIAIQRLYRGWDIEKAVSVPPKSKRSS